MASISTDRKGNRRILFSGPNRKRKIVYLGAVPMKTARTVKTHVEELAAAAMAGHAPAPETSEWVGSRDAVLYDKLAAVGLVPKRDLVLSGAVSSIILGEFLDQYIVGRTDVKPRTTINLQQAAAYLVRFFTRGRTLEGITPGDADNFRIDLMGRVGENTARRHCGRAKQFFRAAQRLKLITENPFADMRGCGVRQNPDKFYFVGRADTQKVIDACPDAQWRLLFALARFGGLRCPSETLCLPWRDVDWDRRRFTVRSPKTEHHEGKGSRQVPIFPELRPYLEEAWENAEAGSIWVITRYRGSGVNLRTQLQRIIEKAGVKPWPKLWQNLRSTRETELVKIHPIHIVCAWLGNSPAIANKHYLQVRDEDFCRAAEGDAESDALPTRNPTQQPTGDSSKCWQETTQALGVQELVPESSTMCNGLPHTAHMYTVPPVGLEPTTT